MTETGGRRVHRYRVPGLAVLLIGGLYLPFLGVPFEYDEASGLLTVQLGRGASPAELSVRWR